MNDDLATWLKTHAKVLKVMGILFLFHLWCLASMLWTLSRWPYEEIYLVFQLVNYTALLLSLLGFSVLLGFMSEERYCKLVQQCVFGRGDHERR